ATQATTAIHLHPIHRLLDAPGDPASSGSTEPGALYHGRLARARPAALQGATATASSRRSQDASALTVGTSGRARRRGVEELMPVARLRRRRSSMADLPRSRGAH